MDKLDKWRYGFVSLIGFGLISLWDYISSLLSDIIPHIPTFVFMRDIIFLLICLIILGVAHRLFDDYYWKQSRIKEVNIEEMESGGGGDMRRMCDYRFCHNEATQQLVFDGYDLFYCEKHYSDVCKAFNITEKKELVMLKANAVLLFFFAVFVVFFVFVVALVLVNGGTVGDGIDTFFNASNRTATGVYHAIRNISMGG